MAENATDILMSIIGPKGPMPGESLTQFPETIGMDALRDGFTPGEFCELMEFTFGVSIVGSRDKEKDKKKQDGTKPAPASTTLLPSHDVVDIEEVEYTRILDSSSTQLFQVLADCDTLPSISVVKRKAAGGTNSGRCYLRLDFERVLLTKLDWKDNGHVMIETGGFLYRKLTIRYRPQNTDGSLGKIIQASWSMQSPRTGA